MLWELKNANPHANWVRSASPVSYVCMRGLWLGGLLSSSTDTTLRPGSKIHITKPTRVHSLYSNLFGAMGKILAHKEWAYMDHCLHYVIMA